MIENIRKYNILIIIGLVVVAAALVIGLQSGSMGGPGGSPYIKIGGRTYTDTEYRQLGDNGRQVVQTLAQSGDFQRMYQFLFSLAPNSMFSASPEDSTEAFFINRMLIRQAKNEFGIHPSDEQIDEFTRSLAAFRGADQEFDPEMYARFVEKGLGRLGMGERQFRDLISDIIATGHLRALIGGGLMVHPDIAAKSNALDQQSISGSVARMELAPFKEKIEPSEEDLRAYWELIQDAFKTEEQRRFSYILVSPDPVEEQASTEDENKEETLADAAMSEEMKAKKAREKAEKEAAIAEKKRENLRTLIAELNQFSDKLIDSKGQDFEKLADEYEWKIVSTELFSRSNPPKELNIPVRHHGNSRVAPDSLFKMTLTADPLSQYSEPLSVGENQYLIARLDETIPSEVKTFEQAQEQVRKQYIEEKAIEELEKAMEEAAEKVMAALEEGKDFAEASASAGLTKVEAFADTTSSTKPENLLFPNGLFRLARSIDPGSLSEVIVQEDRAFLIYVKSREVKEGLNTPDILETQINIAANQNSMAAFSDWLKFEAETSNIERLYR